MRLRIVLLPISYGEANVTVQSRMVTGHTIIDMQGMVHTWSACVVTGNERIFLRRPHWALQLSCISCEEQESVRMPLHEASMAPIEKKSIKMALFQPFQGSSTWCALARGGGDGIRPRVPDAIGLPGQQCSPESCQGKYMPPTGARVAK